MKTIPKDELIALVDALPGNLLIADTMQELFEIYGDDYFRDYGDSEWELVNANEKRSEWISAQEPKKA